MKKKIILISIFPLLVVTFWVLGIFSGEKITIFKAIKYSCQLIKGTFKGVRNA